MPGAFVDILGTKTLALRRRPRYTATLDSFQKEVGQTLRDLAADDKKGGVPASERIGDVRGVLFSDSFIIEGPSFNGLLRLLCHLRGRLLKHGVFIRGACDQKALQFGLRELVGGFHAISLGPQAADLYVAEQSLKGAGVNVLTSAAPPTKWTVQSVYVRATEGGSSRDHRTTEPSFTDIRILAQYLDGKNIDRIVESYLFARHEAPKLSRYYITLLVSWLQSADTSEGSDGGFRDPLLSMIADGTLYKHMRGDVDLVHVTFCFLSRLYAAEAATHATGSVLRSAWDRLVRNPRDLDRLHLVPEALCDQNAREAFLRAVSGQRRLRQDLASKAARRD